MTLAVLVNEGKNDIHEIDLNISPEKNEIYKILRGKATFLGQWPDKSVVIVTCESSIFELSMNLNRLPRPFTNMTVMGKILLVRMDEESEPQDFTIKEYHQMTKETHPRTRSSAHLISSPLSRNISYSSEDSLSKLHAELKM